MHKVMSGELGTALSGNSFKNEIKVIIMEAQEHAEILVNYFERVARENENSEVWQKGLNTSREWLRLINSENVSSSELSNFIGVIHANRYRTSGWAYLSFEAYHWLTSKGVSVPPAKDFFMLDSPIAFDICKMTSMEHAQALYKAFLKNNQEDPITEGWATGLKITQDWIRLIDKNDKDENEIASLVKNVFRNQNEYLGMIWSDTMQAIGLWCKAIGCLHLVPKNFRDIPYIPKVK